MPSSVGSGSVMTDTPDEEVNMLVLDDGDASGTGMFPDELPPFLWEQISSSIDVVELEDAVHPFGLALRGLW